MLMMAGLVLKLSAKESLALRQLTERAWVLVWHHSYKVLVPGASDKLEEAQQMMGSFVPMAAMGLLNDLRLRTIFESCWRLPWGEHAGEPVWERTAFAHGLPWGVFVARSALDVQICRRWGVLISKKDSPWLMSVAMML